MATVLLLNSCEFGDINRNPNSPTAAPVNVLLPSAQAELAYGLHGDIAQFTSLFTQQTGGFESIYLPVSQYDLTSNLAGRVWESNLYPGAMTDLSVIIRKATESNSPHYRGIGRIMMAVALGQSVDLWNNVPYSEAFRGLDEQRILQPRYEQGAALYDTVQTLLTQAITDLQANNSFLSPSRDDLVYTGNRAQWIKAARALQARYHNHLSKVNPTTSAQNALTALQAGTFTSNTDDARIVFGTTQDAASPWFRFLVSSFGNGIRAGQFFVNLLKSKNDPRLPFFVGQVGNRDPNRTENYIGNPAGTPEPAASSIGLYFNRPEAPANFITFIETKFIEAEANFRLSNFQAAATAHNAAVAASIDKITNNTFRINDTLIVRQNATANRAYITAYGSETAGTITLEKIFREKYIALYLEPEVWNDWRRSITPATPNGIPALTPAANSQQFTNRQFPRRWPYPNSEIQRNAANVQAQGAASITNRVFWDL